MEATLVAQPKSQIEISIGLHFCETPVKET